MYNRDNKFYFASKINSFIVSHFPRVKGYALLESMLHKILPFNPKVTILLGSTHRLFLDVRYRSHLLYVAGGGRHEPAVTAFVTAHLEEGDKFFDFGSNWGYYSALASAIVGKNGLVVAVEANFIPESCTL